MVVVEGQSEQINEHHMSEQSNFPANGILTKRLCQRAGSQTSPYKLHSVGSCAGVLMDKPRPLQAKAGTTPKSIRKVQFHQDVDFSGGCKSGRCYDKGVPCVA